MPSGSLSKISERSFEEAYEGDEEILSVSETFSLDLIDKVSVVYNTESIEWQT